MGDLQAIPKSQMSDEERVRDFQRKLYQKAKQEKSFRFYVLYDKVRLGHFLREAYKRCKANDGCAGVDGMTFEDVERYGVDKFLHEIIEELENKSYRPQPVLRVYILKPNGKTRPLGIPVIRDRIVQMAVKLVIEPIFEADFEDSSYGFRPKRSAGDAMRAVKENLKAGREEIFDADLSSYFDTIPHKELLELIGKRISDKNLLHLIKMWLKAPIVEDNNFKGGKGNRIGTPQGGVISPLLANIYLHLLDKAVNREGGSFYKQGIKIIRYADDWLLMSKRLTKEALSDLNNILERMKLKLNAEKSRIINAHKESLDFLGFTVRLSADLFGRDFKKYWNIEPSKKSQKSVRANIDKYLGKHGHKPPKDVAKELNAITRGWTNYFSIKGVSYPNKAKRDLRYYLRQKLTRYYQRKSQRKCKLYNRGAFKVMVGKYGLIDPTKYAFN